MAVKPVAIRRRFAKKRPQPSKRATSRMELVTKPPKSGRNRDEAKRPISSTSRTQKEVPPRHDGYQLVRNEGQILEANGSNSNRGLIASAWVSVGGSHHSNPHCLTRRNEEPSEWLASNSSDVLLVLHPTLNHKAITSLGSFRAGEKTVK
ncbi:uncharacterized protein BJX67DRAFT_344505 [Aspergillus lucknowensis]|uniref:Uncharacterized protein n=1 Tax=Aspergillus lucknowensis TaxID=176173 RepID=A0ABR4M1V8_9EURO